MVNCLWSHHMSMPWNLAWIDSEPELTLLRTHCFPVIWCSATLLVEHLSDYQKILIWHACLVCVMLTYWRKKRKKNDIDVSIGMKEVVSKEGEIKNSQLICMLIIQFASWNIAFRNKLGWMNFLPGRSWLVFQLGRTKMYLKKSRGLSC